MTLQLFVLPSKLRLSDDRGGFDKTTPTISSVVVSFGAFSACCVSTNVCRGGITTGIALMIHFLIYPFFFLWF
jgi:hypothetical protein